MKNKLTSIFSYLSGIFIILIICLILRDIFLAAIKDFSFDFLIEDTLSAGREGGIFPIIVSTFMILLVCIVFVLSIGISCSIFLCQFRLIYPNFVKLVSKSIEILSAVPSIVFGLFGNAIFSVYFGLGFSILSGGLTLAIMSLPLFIKTYEEGIQSIPDNYRKVSSALGLSRLTTIINITIPCSLPSLIIAIVLSIGRSLGETAALIFTSGYVDRLPESFMDSGRSLSVHIYDLSMNVPGGDRNAYKTAFVLITLILFINGFVNFVLKYWYKKKIAL